MYNVHAYTLRNRTELNAKLEHSKSPHKTTLFIAIPVPFGRNVATEKDG